MSTRRFSIGVIEVIVRSDLRWVLDDLAAMYPGPQREGRPRRDAVEMDVHPQRRWPLRRFAIRGDGAEVHRDLARDEVLPYLEWGINRRIVERLDQYLQLHAATVAVNGRGIVLAGPSGCGKSTLAAGMLARGWRYLGDEFALIDPQTTHLRPYPKALCIKAGAFDVIKRLNLRLVGDRHYIKALKGRVGYVSPADAQADPALDQCPIRHVLFPRYVPGSPPRHRLIPAGRAAFALAGQTLNRHAYGRRAVSILGRIVRSATCHALESGDIDDTCRLIESIVS